MLEGDASELRQHVNQQVQVSGRVESSAGSAGLGSGSGSATASGSASGSGSGAGFSGTAGSGGGSATQRLRVDSVQMIAASCSASQ
jgi:hypothetical protein